MGVFQTGIPLPENWTQNVLTGPFENCWPGHLWGASNEGHCRRRVKQRSGPSQSTGEGWRHSARLSGGPREALGKGELGSRGPASRRRWGLGKETAARHQGDRAPRRATSQAGRRASNRGRRPGRRRPGRGRGARNPPAAAPGTPARMRTPGRVSPAPRRRRHAQRPGQPSLQPAPRRDPSERGCSRIRAPSPG